MLLRVLGVIGIIIGVCTIIAAATGVWGHEPGRGYAIGAILTFSGVMRLVRAGRL